MVRKGKKQDLTLKLQALAPAIAALLNAAELEAPIARLNSYVHAAVAHGPPAAKDTAEPAMLIRLFRFGHLILNQDGRRVITLDLPLKLTISFSEVP